MRCATHRGDIANIDHDDFISQLFRGAGMRAKMRAIDECIGTKKPSGGGINGNYRAIVANAKPLFGTWKQLR